eukprot:2805679-Rhodomonas_salina.2
MPPGRPLAHRPPAGPGLSSPRVAVLFMPAKDRSRVNSLIITGVTVRGDALGEFNWWCSWFWGLGRQVRGGRRNLKL